MKQIRTLIILVNSAGAISIYMYFKFILETGNTSENIPAFFHELFLVITTVVLTIIGIWGNNKNMKSLYKIAGGQTDINSLEAMEVCDLQRKALQFPIIVSIVTFIIWVMAGFTWGFLEPLISNKLFNTNTPSLIICLRQFIGISILGGSITSMILYFVIENTWRNYLPKFFPEGNLRRVKNVFKLNIRKRFFIVFIGIIFIPLPVLSLTLYSKIVALHMADAITRTKIMSSLVGEFAFVAVDSLAICLIMVFFLAKSIKEPLVRIKEAIKEVKNNKLDTRVEIVSNDELGDLSESLNMMIQSMQESQNLKESFGKYVSEEIRDEIMAGKVSLDGEMKRATLLFSDLRNFTTLVEENHPKHVVTIMNQYFNEMTLAVKANKGLILQYVGDEIEAVFGAPIGFDDHPDMALKAALEMRRRMDILNMRLEQQGFEPLSHGIGIHSGAVLAGNIGSEERMSYALVGDTVNTASRIEGLTKQYECDLIISQTTYNLLTESYDTEQLAPVKVKGKKDGLIIYKVL